MPTREELIAAKAGVQARIRTLLPKVEAAYARAQAASGVRHILLTRRTAALQAQLDALMAEEQRLRLEIDRTPRG